jgi:hypothetical protein
MKPVGLANTQISTGYAQKSPRSLVGSLGVPLGKPAGGNDALWRDDGVMQQLSYVLVPPKQT